jgi:choline dehydrogenase-like flavoprotein
MVTVTTGLSLTLIALHITTSSKNTSGSIGAAKGNEMLPDGQFLPAMKMSCGEVLLREKVKAKFGHTVTIGRVAIVTQNHNGRLACHYCGPCERGCSTFSYFSSPFTTVKDAQKSGNCTLITNAVVSQVNMDNLTNKARGVTYVDRITRQVKEVRGKAVILCAQALESTRILLNSSTREYSAGLANSSGVLGHYLMDHVVGGGASGRLPDLKTLPNANEPQRPNGVYVPRFRNTPSSKKHRISFAVTVSRAEPTPTSTSTPKATEPVQSSKKATQHRWGAGESLARKENFARSIQSRTRGYPTLHIVMSHGDNEAALMEDAGASATEMLETCRSKDIPRSSRFKRPAWPFTSWAPRMERRSENLGPQCLQSKPRREKPFCDGRCQFRVIRLPESDADHDGHHRPSVRSSDRSLPPERRSVRGRLFNRSTTYPASRLRADAGPDRENRGSNLPIPSSASPPGRFP